MALITPFAVNGNRAPIPATTSDGSVSYDQGFGSFYALPPEEGGLFIDRAQFNQLMYDTTSQVLANKQEITTIQGDLTTINNTISQVVSSDVTPIGVYKNVENKTVGANGDFKTIQEAFVYAQTHRKQGIVHSLTLTLLENLNNPILYFLGAWYPYLVIDCNGFVLADKLTIDLSCFRINNLKLNDRLVAVASILWLYGNNIDISHRGGDYPYACITAHSTSLINVVGDLTLRPAARKAGIGCRGGSLVFVSCNSIRQTTGLSCLFCSDGGLIQLHGGTNLTGVTVPKANIAANTLTRNGIIFGNYAL